MSFLYWLVGICVTIFIGATAWSLVRSALAERAYRKVRAAESELKEKIKTTGGMTQEVQTAIETLIGKIQKIEKTCLELENKTDQKADAKELKDAIRTKMQVVDDLSKEVEETFGNAYRKIIQEIKAKESIGVKPDPYLYFTRGMNAFNRSKLDEAIANYDEAIRLKPDFAEAFNNRGYAKSNLGRTEEAIYDFDEAIRLKPNFANAFCNRGNAKEDIIDYEGAIKDYNEAIRLKPDYVRVFNDRGVLKAKMGDETGAKADFEKAEELGAYQRQLPTFLNRKCKP
jgi:tetratricopeptide (TPR) repeat protein